MPDAFSRVGRSGEKFRCSEQFVRHFLHKELGWSVRKATRAAQKYPSNVNQVLLDAFLRLACTIRDEAVPACCIVNADQTQVVYSPGDQKTWNTTGERQVSIVGTEDKRAFTLLVSASCSGDVLPFQAIYSGKSKRSLPDSTSPGYDEAHKLGFLLDYSDTTTYWSTLATMKRWVSKILVPYFISQREQHNLPESQRCILQIDCWSVHRSEIFLDWMEKTYPWIDIKFIPAGCTGLFQACDVGIQRVLKIAIRNVAHADVVTETVHALKSGVKPECVVNDQSLPTLRRRSVRWLVQGYHAINKPSLIKKAFALCAVPGTPFNLSYESLNGRDARRALHDLLSSDPQLYAKIASATSLNTPKPPNSASEASEPVFNEDDEDESSPTAEEAEARILNTQVAQGVSKPVWDMAESEEEQYEGYL
ncbi:hypothetical protein FRC06_011105 [Ceratobasidium sp. 370]|nr:hypothetical protein FRC06_011105 [Ceratobasidium sp. 370]